MIYYFYGQDEWAIKEAVREIFQKMPESEKMVLEGPSILSTDLEKEVITVPFFSTQRLVAIENLSLNKKTTEIEKVVKLLDRSTEHLHLIFAEFHQPDKRTGLHKKLIKIAQSKEFNLPSTNIVAKRIQMIAQKMGSSIDNYTAFELAKLIPKDGLRLEQEVKKISLYRLGEKIVTTDFKEMIAPEISANIFYFVEQLTDHNFPLAMRSLAELLATGQNEQYIISMIAWQYRQLIMIKAGLLAGDATADKIGINPYVFSKLSAIARKIDLDDLRDIYQKIEETDFAIKTGQLEAQMAIELFTAKSTTC